MKDPWVEAPAMDCEVDRVNVGVRENTSTPTSSPSQVTIPTQFPSILFSDPMLYGLGPKSVYPLWKPMSTEREGAHAERVHLWGRISCREGACQAVRPTARAVGGEARMLSGGGRSAARALCGEGGRDFASGCRTGGGLLGISVAYTLKPKRLVLCRYTHPRWKGKWRAAMAEARVSFLHQLPVLKL